MKKLLLSLIMFISITTLAACDSQTDSQFDESGNFLRADDMQEAWCEYNKGRDFAQEQCDID